MGNYRSTGLVLLAVLAVAGVAFLGITRSAESSDAGQVGRYQLAVGSYESTVGKGLPDKDDALIVRRGVFRIDTATGDTWVLKERIDTSSVVADHIEMEWVLID
jgi:hypothetical protein